MAKEEPANVTYAIYINGQTKEKLDDLTARLFFGNKSGFWKAIVENLADAPDVVVQGVTGSLPKESAGASVEAICEYFHKRYGVPQRRK